MATCRVVCPHSSVVESEGGEDDEETADGKVLRGKEKERAKCLLHGTTKRWLV